MTIGNAIQRDGQVYVYDLRGNIILMLPAGSGKHDGLKGYTSDTVNIQMDSSVYCYDKKGQIISVAPTT